MRHRFLMIAVCGILAGGVSTAAEAGLKYFSDPVYRKLNAEDHHPMDDMISLAEQGETRAQFIIADMYQKGKGGLAKDLDKARRWFEESAMHGYNYSFVRLAAIAKHEKKVLEAWQWYTLAIDTLDYEEGQKFAIKARKALIEAEKITQEDMNRGRKAINAWKEARNAHLREERDAAQARKDKERREEKEKMALSAAEKKVMTGPLDKTAEQDKKNPKQERKNEQD